LNVRTLFGNIQRVTEYGLLLPTNLSLKKKVLPKKEKNKMADEKIQMPSGIGGLVRYFDDYKSKIEIPNMVFIAFCVLVIIFYLYLHFG